MRKIMFALALLILLCGAGHTQTQTVPTQAEIDARNEVNTKIMPLYTKTAMLHWKILSKLTTEDASMAASSLETFLRTLFGFMDQQRNFINGTDTTALKKDLTNYANFIRSRVNPAPGPGAHSGPPQGPLVPGAPPFNQPTDFAGRPWKNPPSMGAYQFWPVSIDFQLQPPLLN
jgi:hypothetical protein